MAAVNEPMPVGDISSPQQILAAARMFLSDGNFRDALASARKANELSGSPEAQELILSTESAWLKLLRTKLLNEKRTPVLKVPPSKLKAMSLTAPERYLLSRFDGKRDLATIVNVSPLRELEALAHVSRFVELGLITVD